MSLDDYFATHTVGTNGVGFSAAKLPELPSGLSWVAVPQEGALPGETDYFKSLMVAGPRKAVWQYFIERANDILHDIMRHQYLLHMMNFPCIPPLDTDFSPLGNSSCDATWKVIDVTNGVITCQWQTGDVDPHSIVDFWFTENPEWIPGVPETGSRLNSTSVTGKARWGSVSFNHPSQMKHYGPIRVKRWVFPASNPPTNGQTFQIVTDSNISSEFMELIPGESGDITITWRQWNHRYREMWKRVVLIAQMFCVRGYLSTTNYTSDHVIFEGRVRPWADDAAKRWMKIYRFLVADPLTAIDVTDQVKPLMKITHSGANGFQTWVDLSSTGWGAETAGVVFDLYMESDDDNAIATDAQVRCQHSVKDWSRSVNAGENYYYCEQEDASGRGSHIDQCSLCGVCDKYAVGKPSAANDPDFWEQIIAAQPFYQRQIMAGIPQFEVLHIDNGVPSLQAAAQINLDVPVTYSPTQSVVWRPDWTDYEVVEGGAGVDDEFAKLDGIEQGMNDGDVRDTAWTGKAASFAGATVNDPYSAMLTSNSPTIYLHNFQPGGTIGAYQRCGDRLWHFLCEVPGDGDEPVTQNGVTITRGLWNELWQEVEDDGDAVYDILIQVQKCMSMYNKDRTVHGGLKFSGECVNAGTGTIELQNRVVELTSLGGVGENQTHELRCGATIARAMNYDTLNNESAWVSPRGNMRESFAQAGDCIYCEALGKRLPIIQTTPYGGAVQSWKPDTMIHSRSSETNYYFVEFARYTEEVSTVIVTRNSGATTLTGEEGLNYHEAFAKDVYLYRQQYTYDGSTLKRGVFFEFSKNQVTGVAADQVLSITVKTDSDANTYGPYTLNLNDEWTSKCQVTIDGETFTGVDSVTLEWQDEFGEFHEVEMSAILAPANPSLYGDDEYSITVNSSTNWTFKFPISVIGATVKIRATLPDFTGSENDYYNGYIAPHSASFPAGVDFASVGNKGDVLSYIDENGIVADSSFDFEGETIQIRSDAVMHWSGSGEAAQIRIDASDATPISSSLYVVFGAEGEIFIKKGNMDSAKKLYLALPMAEHDCMMIASELAAIRNAEDLLLGGA